MFRDSESSLSDWQVSIWSEFENKLKKIRTIQIKGISLQPLLGGKLVTGDGDEQDEKAKRGTEIKTEKT